MPFLKSLRLDGLLSFPPGSEAIELQPLNVLIGPNGSGKSNLIEGIELLHALPTGFASAIRDGGGVREWLWKGDDLGGGGIIEAQIDLDPRVGLARLYGFSLYAVDLRYRLAFNAIGQRVEVIDEVIENSNKTDKKAKDVFFYYRFLGGNPVINVTESIGGKRNERHLERQTLLPDESVLSQRKDPVSYPELTELGKRFGRIQSFREWSYGSWKPMPKARPAPPPQLAKIDDDVQSDVPVLHRKHHPGETPTGGTGAGAGSASGSGSGDSSASQAPPPDPDRPTLHKGGDASGNSTSTGTGTTSSTDSSSDSGQPTLHRHDSSDSSGSGSGNGAASSDDPDRPVLKKNKKQQAADIAHVDSLPDVSDPDRPRLKRGKSEGYALNVIPSLMGIPQDMQQMVAVSDAKSRPEHPWDYTWSNPDDEANMKEALEDIARNALGLNAPPAPPAPAAKKTTASKKSTKPVPPPPPPAELEGEQFRVFELAYGSGATMVLQAHTAGPLAQEKFVTLVAQPDLYGHPMVLLKNITDGAHLDETPRMRLVDAVDAMADNRGELLFELRGATQRQFALYRVLRGQAEKLFVSGGGDFGIERE